MNISFPSYSKFHKSHTVCPLEKANPAESAMEHGVKETNSEREKGNRSYSSTDGHPSTSTGEKDPSEESKPEGLRHTWMLG